MFTRGYHPYFYQVPGFSKVSLFTMHEGQQREPILVNPCLLAPDTECCRGYRHDDLGVISFTTVYTDSIHIFPQYPMIQSYPHDIPVNWLDLYHHHNPIHGHPTHVNLNQEHDDSFPTNPFGGCLKIQPKTINRMVYHHVSHQNGTIFR